MHPKHPLFTLFHTHLIFFVFLSDCFVFSFQQLCNRQDQSTLLIFSGNISTSSSAPLNWSSSISCCQWEGIECNVNGRVTHLHLPSRGLNGVISSSIIHLGMLTHLNLSNNFLHGPLREEFSRLTKLRIMDLSSNRISGSIPKKIGKLLYLEELHLYHNNLSGPIQPSLMNCTHLVEILLRDNNLHGDISQLDFSKLIRLQKLDLKNNSLSGTLPESIYSCKSLVAIRIAQNNLTGEVSPKIIELKSLSFVSFAYNSLTNITKTLRVLAKCKNLTTLFLSSNFYGESLPIHTNFIGLGEFQKLQFFFLHNCKFAPGPIPNWLTTLRELRVLSLKGNRFTGTVPNWLGTLPNLFNLEINNNSLFGEIPLSLCQFPTIVSQNVQELEFSQFELPIFTSNSGDKYTYIRFKADYYHGLGLSHNAFKGNIPIEIGNLQSLQQLYLNDNHFSGHIPVTISNLKKLEKLDLSTNNLIGEIPRSLTSLSFLSQFNVSYNDLNGPIPTAGQFATFQKSCFEGNPDLCGEPLNHSCYNPTIASRVDRREDRNMQWFIDGLFVGLASGFCSILLVVASYVWFNYYKQHKPCSRRG